MFGNIFFNKSCDSEARPFVRDGKKTSGIKCCVPLYAGRKILTSLVPLSYKVEDPVESGKRG